MNFPNHDDSDPATKQRGPFNYSWEEKLENRGGVSFKYAIKIQDGSGHQCDKDPRISKN